MLERRAAELQNDACTISTRRSRTSTAAPTRRRGSSQTLDAQLASITDRGDGRVDERSQRSENELAHEEGSAARSAGRHLQARPAVHDASDALRPLVRRAGRSLQVSPPARRCTTARSSARVEQLRDQVNDERNRSSSRFKRRSRRIARTSSAKRRGSARSSASARRASHRREQRGEADRGPPRATQGDRGAAHERDRLARGGPPPRRRRAADDTRARRARSRRATTASSIGRSTARCVYTFGKAQTRTTRRSAGTASGIKAAVGAGCGRSRRAGS